MPLTKSKPLALLLALTERLIGKRPIGASYCDARKA